MNHDVEITVLSIAVLLSLLLLVKFLRRRSYLRAMVVGNYAVVQFVSGIVHLSNIPGASRGFYDLLLDPEAGNVATWAALLGGVALAAGLHLGGGKRDGGRFAPHAPNLGPSDKSLLGWTIVLFGPLCLYALGVTLAYTAGSTRVISISDGNARFSFMATWLVWIISFACVLIVFAAGLGERATLLTLVVGTAAIAATLAWSGGRSVVLVMIIPIFATLYRRLGKWRIVTIVTALVAGSLYIFSISETRSLGEDINFAEWADWQWGRFSMSGFAFDWVRENGHLNGETIAYGFVTAANSLLHLVGIALPDPSLRSSMEIAGYYILGSGEKIYVVPGMTSELYLNFGIIGVIVGFLVLGVVVRSVEVRFARSSNPIGMLFWSYVGGLLVLRTISADSGAILSYLAFGATPLLVVFALSTWRRNRPKRSKAGLTVLGRPASVRDEVDR